MIGSPDRTLQLGTTSGFLFLYSSEAADPPSSDLPSSDPPSDEAADPPSSDPPSETEGFTALIFERIFGVAKAIIKFAKAVIKFIYDFYDFVFWDEETEKKGKTFIVPLANLASLMPIDNTEKKEWAPTGSASPDFTLSKISPLVDSKKKAPRKTEKPPCVNWEQLGTIGPFGRAEHELARSQTNSAADEDHTPSPVVPEQELHCESGYDRQTDSPDERNDLLTLVDLEKKLNRKLRNCALQQLVLIGRADTTRLVGQALQNYKSNRGLAQERAKWVWEQLKQEATVDRKQVILLNAAFLHTDPGNYHYDRSVEVHACWAPRPEQANSSADSGD